MWDRLFAGFGKAREPDPERLRAEREAAAQAWSRRSRAGPTYLAPTRLPDLSKALKKAGLDYELVVVTAEGRDKSLVLKCPCGCGDVLTLNLDPSRKPVWALQRAPGGATSVFPRIGERSRCGTRFLLVRNQARIF